MGWTLSNIYTGSWSINQSLPGAALNSQGQLLINFMGPNHALTYMYPLPTNGNATPISIRSMVSLGNAFTTTSPSAVFLPGGELCYFLWHGQQPDLRMFCGLILPPATNILDKPIPGATGQDGPLGVFAGGSNPRFGNGMVVTWKGLLGDATQFMTTITNLASGPASPAKPYPMTQISGGCVGAYSASMVVSPEGALFGAWQGAPADTRIYYSVSLNPAVAGFLPQTPVSAGDALIHTTDRVSLTIVNAEEKAQLVLVYVVVDKLFYTVGTYDKVFNVTWTPPEQVPKTTELFQPAGVWATSPNPHPTSACLLVGDRTADGQIDDVLYLLTYSP